MSGLWWISDESVTSGKVSNAKPWSKPLNTPFQLILKEFESLRKPGVHKSWILSLTNLEDSESHRIGRILSLTEFKDFESQGIWMWTCGHVWTNRKCLLLSSFQQFGCPKEIQNWNPKISSSRLVNGKKWKIKVTFSEILIVKKLLVGQLDTESEIVWNSRSGS